MASKVTNKNASSLRKLRILCLHGHAQTPQGFREKTGSIRQALKSTCDFQFLEGPVQIPPCEHSSEWANSWVDFSKLGVPEKDKTTDSEKDKNSSQNLNSSGPLKSFAPSIELLDKTIIESEIDGLLGFSLGAGVIIAYLSKLKELYGDQCCEPSSTYGAKRLRFAALFSGFFPNKDPVLEKEIREGLKEFVENISTVPIPSGGESNAGESNPTIPPYIPTWSSKNVPSFSSYHCFGEKDEIIIPERSREVFEVFENGKKENPGVEKSGKKDTPGTGSHEVFTHPGGHLVPSQAKKSFTDFVKGVREQMEVDGLLKDDGGTSGSNGSAANNASNSGGNQKRSSPKETTEDTTTKKHHPRRKDLLPEGQQDTALRKYLLDAKKRFTGKAEETILVLGNTSCDLDSVASAIGYAAHKNLIPVLNTKKSDYVKLIQQSYFLDSQFGIGIEDLVFWEDVVGEDSSESSASDLKFMLVDHNEVDYRQKGFLKGKVIGCLDHHERSEGFEALLCAEAGNESSSGFESTYPIKIYPPSTKSPLCGSTASMIMTEIAGDLEKKNSEENENRDNLLQSRDDNLLTDITLLLTGAILTDTRNFSEQTYGIKWSEYDQEAFSMALQHLKRVEAFKFDKDKLAQELVDIKFDLDLNLGIGINGLLGADFKAFVYNVGTSTEQKIHVGYASMPVNLSEILDSRKFSMPEIGQAILEFMDQGQMGMLIILSSNLNHEKELGICTKNNSLFAENSKNLPPLKAMLREKADTEEFHNIVSEAATIQFHKQKNKALSRKQLEPMIKDFISNFLS